MDAQEVQADQTGDGSVPSGPTRVSPVGPPITGSTLTSNEYQAFALSKEADQEAINARRVSYGVKACRLENGLRGLTDEVGELAGQVKGWIEYGRPLDEHNILEECGDVLWRTSQILAAVGYTLEQAMRANLGKLAVRYAGRCNDAEANNRNLEAERTSLLSGVSARMEDK